MLLSFGGFNLFKVYWQYIKFSIHYQIAHNIFHRTRTNNPKIYMEPQKTQNYQSNPEQQKSSKRHNSPRLQAIL